MPPSTVDPGRLRRADEWNVERQASPHVRFAIEDVAFLPSIVRDFALWGTTFRVASLRGHDFSGAHLCDAVFEDVDLSGVSFRRAKLRGAVFRRCSMESAEFEGADLRASVFDEIRGATCDTLRSVIEGRRTAEELHEKSRAHPELNRLPDDCGHRLADTAVTPDEVIDRLAALRGALGEASEGVDGVTRRVESLRRGADAARRALAEERESVEDAFAWVRESVRQNAAPPAASGGATPAGIDVATLLTPRLDAIDEALAPLASTARSADLAALSPRLDALAESGARRADIAAVSARLDALAESAARRGDLTSLREHLDAQIEGTVRREELAPLAGQLDDLAKTVAHGDAVSDIARRLDALAQCIAGRKQLADLGARLEALAASTGSRDTLADLGQRLDTIAELGARREDVSALGTRLDALGTSNAALPASDRLVSQTDAVHGRLDGLRDAITALDRRFDAVAGTAAPPGDNAAVSVRLASIEHAVASVAQAAALDERFVALELRLDALSRTLTAAPAETADGPLVAKAPLPVGRTAVAALGSAAAAGLATAGGLVLSGIDPGAWTAIAMATIAALTVAFRLRVHTPVNVDAKLE